MEYRVMAMLLLAGCAQQSSEDMSLSAERAVASSEHSGAVLPSARTEFFEIIDSAAKADSVAVARLDAVSFSAPDRDRFLTSMRFEVTDVLRGPLRPGDVLRVRHILGQEPNGDWRWTADTPFLSPDASARMRVGEHFLLLTSRGTYEAQARARGGTALEGNTGAGLGLYRVRGGAIEPTGPYRLPAAVEDLRKLVKGE